jgi:hypothetical protein
LTVAEKDPLGGQLKRPTKVPPKTTPQALVKITGLPSHRSKFIALLDSFFFF